MPRWISGVVLIATCALVSSCAQSTTSSSDAKPATTTSSASSSSATSQVANKSVELRKAGLAFQVPESWLVVYKEDPESTWSGQAKEKKIPAEAITKVKSAFDAVALDGSNHFVGAVSMGGKIPGAEAIMLGTMKSKCSSGFKESKTKTPVGAATSFSCSWDQGGKLVPIHGVAGQGGKGMYLVVGMLGTDSSNFDTMISTLTVKG